MALQSHRRTSSDKRRRASHFALKKTNLSACKQCHAAVQSHRTCPKCGNYQKGSASASTSAKATADKKATAGK